MIMVSYFKQRVPSFQDAALQSSQLLFAKDFNSLPLHSQAPLVRFAVLTSLPRSSVRHLMGCLIAGSLFSAGGRRFLFALSPCPVSALISKQNYSSQVFLFRNAQWGTDFFYFCSFFCFFVFFFFHLHDLFTFVKHKQRPVDDPMCTTCTTISTIF